MEGECTECVDKSNTIYQLEEQISGLQDIIEDLHAKLAAKGPAQSLNLEVAARQIVFHRNMIFMLDAAGTLWMANEFRLVENREIEWRRLSLPDMEALNG